MNDLGAYRDIIEHVLNEHARLPLVYVETKNQLVFDRGRDNYLLMRDGWGKSRRIHHCVIHMEIIDGKIWIQRDRTECGIAHALEDNGIAKSEIVLGYHEPHVRQHTEYAVA